MGYRGFELGENLLCKFARRAKGWSPTIYREAREKRFPDGKSEHSVDFSPMDHQNILIDFSRLGYFLFPIELYLVLYYTN